MCSQHTPFRNLYFSRCRHPDIIYLVGCQARHVNQVVFKNDNVLELRIFIIETFGKDPGISQLKDTYSSLSTAPRGA